MSRFMILAGVIVLAASAAHAQTYDVAADWSTTQNPNGVWTFGESDSLGGVVTPYTFLVSFSGLEQWRRVASPDPNVTHNPTSSPIVFGSYVLEAGETSFHPGQSGERSVVRFTAPSAGDYDVSASFSGADFEGPTTTDVHVLVNGSEVFGAEVNGFGPPSAQSYVGSHSLSAGDTVDFVVGVGPNGTYEYDMTILSVTITGPGADLNGDGDVDGFDLALLLGQWTGAASYSPCPPQADADLNADCKVNGFDLALLLGAWG